MKKQTLLLALLFIFQGVFVACDKKKDDVPVNPLLNTEWSDDNGKWLFSFNTPDKFKLNYKIAGMPHPLSYDVSYRVEGDNLIVDDFQFSAHGGQYYLIKGFTGKIAGIRIDCSFETPKIPSGGGMPDFKALERVNVVLKKK